MSETKTAFKKLIEALKTDRDELRVQMQLGASEMKEELKYEWEVTERGWGKLREKLREAGASISENADDIGEELGEFSEQAREAGEKAAAEIRDGYQRLRSLLKRKS